ncbi:MAG TPA: DNA mismatch repair protein MutL, partial [Opitutae bacterium]|nr:DNA mismatch repair protein MutL [Opitutae bacterium]
GRTIFKSPACDSMQDRVSEIFGKNFSEALVPIHNDKDGMMLKGLIGKPGQSRSTRKEMIFFVNQRP